MQRVGENSINASKRAAVRVGRLVLVYLAASV